MSEQEEQWEEGALKPDAKATPAGWYPNPAGSGLRYYSGAAWTESYHPGHATRDEGASPRDVLWGLALGFGVAGGLPAAIGIPVLAYYFPLGLGGAGLAIAIAAAMSGKGDTPWWAFVAVIASIYAIAQGGSGYDEFSSASEGLNDLRDSFGS